MHDKKESTAMTNKKDKYEMTDEERTEFYKELEKIRKSPQPDKFLMMDSIISENKSYLGEEFQMTAEGQK